ncbi:hypothetical protein KPH14_013038, partial [Odynerus spinipes]
MDFSQPIYQMKQSNTQREEDTESEGVEDISTSSESIYLETHDTSAETSDSLDETIVENPSIQNRYPVRERKNREFP